VVVAVVAVRMMQAAIDQVIEMIAVRHLFVSATLVLALARRRRTVVRVCRAYRQNVLIIMAFVCRVQTAIVQKIDVAVMPNARMPAVLAVDVLVMVVDFVAHATLSSRERVANCIGSPPFLTIDQKGHPDNQKSAVPVA
jgi:hypothetical protein